MTMTNFDMPPQLKAVAIWAGQTLGTLAVFGVAATYWINTEVERRMIELASDPGSHPVIVDMRSDLDHLSTGQNEIKKQVGDFSTEFMKYLQRQAELNQ